MKLQLVLMKKVVFGNENHQGSCRVVRTISTRINFHISQLDFEYGNGSILKVDLKTLKTTFVNSVLVLPLDF